jgi:thiamine-monophosphate kinase
VPGDTRRRGEFALIAELLAPLSTGDARSLSLKDDAAVVPRQSDTDLIVTTDTMVSGVHFLAGEPPEVIARRLLRVNLSDLAAMAAVPLGYFLNLTLSDGIDDSWLEAFVRGLRTDQEIFAIRLLGGDTTRTPGPLTLSVTALGETPPGAAVRRDGARPGELVMVSGTVGDAGLGLTALSSGAAGDEDDAYLIGRYQLPEPRVGLGVALRGLATAMADVSDGLIADLGHICEASGLAAHIDGGAVPLSAAARRRLEAGETDLQSLLSGGDDYELVFTIKADALERVQVAARAASIGVTRIGKMSEGAAQVAVTGPDGRGILISRTGYTHF